MATTKQQIKYTCECGSTISKRGKYRHVKTLKHLKWLENDVKKEMSEPTSEEPTSEQKSDVKLCDLFTPEELRQAEECERAIADGIDCLQLRHNKRKAAIEKYQIVSRRELQKHQKKKNHSEIFFLFHVIAMSGLYSDSQDEYCEMSKLRTLFNCLPKKIRVNYEEFAQEYGLFD